MIDGNIEDCFMFDEGVAGSGARLAGLLAVHLVSQVLDEAYFIANAATESGQPWRYLALLKDLRSGHLISDEDNLTFCEIKIDEDGADKKVDAVANILATSTPQKVAIDKTQKVSNEITFIGQGDEDAEIMGQHGLGKSTSMFINNLFDMSEVEQDIDNSEYRNDSNDVITESMTHLLNSYVNTALRIAFGQESSVKEKRSGEVSPSSENSGYSFLTNAHNMDKAFCVDCKATCSTISTADEIRQDIKQTMNETVKKEDVAFYENTYLTLNRDYDHCSDEDGEPVEDTKRISLHEIELVTEKTSNENSPRTEKAIPQAKSKELQSTSAQLASASDSHKSKLVKRCRTQGAKLLSRLRGWWRRNTPGKRKEARVSGSARGLCPLSPDARRASLLDQRKLTSGSEHKAWKFNTFSEAVVNSSRWRNYTFDVIPDESGEY